MPPQDQADCDEAPGERPERPSGPPRCAHDVVLPLLPAARIGERLPQLYPHSVLESLRELGAFRNDGRTPSEQHAPCLQPV